MYGNAFGTPPLSNHPGGRRVGGYGWVWAGEEEEGGPRADGPKRSVSGSDLTFGRNKYPSHLRRLTRRFQSLGSYPFIASFWATDVERK